MKFNLLVKTAYLVSPSMELPYIDRFKNSFFPDWVTTYRIREGIRANFTKFLSDTDNLLSVSKYHCLVSWLIDYSFIFASEVLVENILCFIECTRKAHEKHELWDQVILPDRPLLSQLQFISGLPFLSSLFSIHTTDALSQKPRCFMAYPWTPSETP